MRLFPNRRGQPAAKWALFRWYDIILDGELYLSRLNLLKTPWFSIKLHWIHRPDPDRDLHDHPWWFVSFVLRGGYEEYESEYPRIFPGQPRQINWFNFKNKTTAHRISQVKPNTITLIVSGPKDREKDWGFYDRDTLEYTPWNEYEGVGGPIGYAIDKKGDVPPSNLHLPMPQGVKPPKAES